MNKLVCLIPALCITACATTPGPAGGPSVPLINAAGQTIGSVVASQATDGVAFRIHATGLPAGVHGIHVHPIGRCDPPDFASAGGHWNPLGARHGTLNPAGPHMGDLPNLDVGTDGRATLAVNIPGATMTGLLDGDGAAIVVHAGRDDMMTDPAGNSGARIACGVFAAG